MNIKQFLFSASILLGILLVSVLSVTAQCTKCVNTTNTPAGASAVGTANTASGINSFAGGTQSIASGNQSFAFGNLCTASGSPSVAIGQAVFTQGGLSYGIGHTIRALASESFGFGQYLETTVNNSMVIGRGIEPNKLLSNNIAYSLMIGFNSTKPTLFVGPSPTENGFGKVGIGTTTPNTTLHVNGDLTVSSLSNTNNGILLSTDATGKLVKVPITALGDNMGNCIAGHSVLLGDHAIRKSGLTDGMYSRPDGAMVERGLQFQAGDNDMVLEPGMSDARFRIVSNGHSTSSVWLQNYDDGGYGFVLQGNGTAGFFHDGNNPSPVMLFNGGSVGIGVEPPSSNGLYGLYVTKGILTEEVLVELKNTGTHWPDYVFNSGYKLRTLNEVETFIAENGHLPDVPNAETVKNGGINLGEMNALLLKKIEELTLYVIELKKENDAIKERLDEKQF